MRISVNVGMGTKYTRSTQCSGWVNGTRCPVAQTGIVNARNTVGVRWIPRGKRLLVQAHWYGELLAQGDNGIGDAFNFSEALELIAEEERNVGVRDRQAINQTL